MGAGGPGPKILKTLRFLTDFWVLGLVEDSAGILGPVAPRTSGESPCGRVPAPFLPETVVFKASWPVCRAHIVLFQTSTGFIVLLEA